MTRAVVDNAPTFRTRTAIILAACGILAFAASLVLGAYAPDMRSGNNGSTHGLSKSAVGLSGLVALAEATGRYPIVVRDETELDSEDLAVISPSSGDQPMDQALAQRGQRITLIVLPKWSTEPMPTHPGWVRSGGLTDRASPQGVLAPTWTYKVSRRKGTGAPLALHGFLAGEPIEFHEPPIVQSISGEGIEPFITDGAGNIILGRMKDSQLFVLSDPDLINNSAMADPRQARAALALLDGLNSTDADGILFDATIHGFGKSRSPLKLMFDPPFLSITLALFAAFLLAAWQAAVRFGAPVHDPRAIAFGKAALVDNSAALVRRAGREAVIGKRYVDVIRARAAALFRLPPSLSDAEVDERLDRLATRPFTPLAALAEHDGNRTQTLHAAQELHRWIQEIEQ